MSRVRSRGGDSNFLALIYLIFGLYLVNHGFGLFVIPEFFLPYDKWVLTFAGFVLFVAAYRKVIYSKGAIIKRFIRRSGR